MNVEILQIWSFAVTYTFKILHIWSIRFDVGYVFIRNTLIFNNFVTPGREPTHFRFMAMHPNWGKNPNLEPILDEEPVTELVPSEVYLKTWESLEPL